MFHYYVQIFLNVENSYKCALERHRKRCESNIEMEHTEGGFIITCRCFGVETSYKCALGRHRKRCESNIEMEHTEGGKRWRSWLRHCATIRKVAGLIPDGFFYCHNPSGRTMSLGSTQPLTDMSTRNISWGVKAAGA